MPCFQNHSDGGAIIDLLEYADALYSYAIVLSRSQTEAEDLVHETYLRALRSMERLRPDINIKSWLFTILRNIWLNQLRQSRAFPQVPDIYLGENSAIEPVDASNDPYATYISNNDRERVRNAIQRLPLESREIILLREYEEFSYEEIATPLDCPLGTVMSRLARARPRLHDWLMVVSPLQRKTAIDANQAPEWDPAGDG